MALGFTKVSVLDISETAIERARKRLGNSAAKVSWIASDIKEFESEKTFDLWHDRAVFHFLTDENDIQKYVELTEKLIRKNGTLIIGTFSENGPKKCSGIEIKQYSETDLIKLFEPRFEPAESFTVDHTTPFDTIQNFTFCRFRRL